MQHSLFFWKLILESVDNSDTTTDQRLGIVFVVLIVKEERLSVKTNTIVRN